MKPEIKKQIMLHLPYLAFVYLFGKVGQAFRLAQGADLSGKLLHIGQGFSAAFASAAPSFHPTDLLIGLAAAVIIRLVVYSKQKNAKKYRKGMEYGTARWGTVADIKPFIDPVFDNNVLLTQTERLMMSNRPKDPKNARNKNILVIGGSGSGKTRFFCKPNIMQLHSSYVITDPKGSLICEVGQLLQRAKYRIAVLNTINFSKSMHYNPFAYLRTEKDILKLVNTIIINTKGEGAQSTEDFWVKAERLYYTALIGYIQDIQSYGQLKTLGTTKRQIKKLISKQAMLLSFIGIPFGLLIGFFVGRALVPFLMNGTVYASDAGVKVTANPIIFIGAALFALVTVIISVNKPAKIAGSVSPIEAIRYTENDATAFQGKKTSNKKSIHGAKIHRMALSNLGRNKKRTILVIISMTLSLVLFNTVFTLASGFDVEKYVEKFVNKDFIISTADYFNFKFGNSDSKNDLSTSFIEAVKQNPAFDEGGELYTTKILEEAFSVENGVTSNYNKDAEGNPLVQLYGADDFLLNSMDVIEGTIDWEALKSGNYVLYALTADDNGNIIDDPNIHVGDTLHFNHVQMNGLSSSIDNNFDCKVMAKVLINENTDTIRSTGFAKFYMPTDVFLPLCEQPHLVSFPFNVVDGMEADMEEFLSSYVEDIEPSMNYDSKQTYINSFNDLTSLIITIGGALSIIIGLIGITNFVNSVLTSIITRRKELAMLQSIGMTGKQLKKMLSFEGLYYAAGTVVASIVFGSLVSVIIVRAISNSIWFFTYKFVIFPMFVIYPFLIALTVIIPAIIYRKIAKTSIIERLHQN